jgi:hypothetical protein
MCTPCIALEKSSCLLSQQPLSKVASQPTNLENVD